MSLLLEAFTHVEIRAGKNNLKKTKTVQKRFYHLYLRMKVQKASLQLPLRSLLKFEITKTHEANIAKCYSKILLEVKANEYCDVF